MDEESLIREAIESKEAVEKLIRLYYRDIYEYIYRITLNNAITEDITQDVFLYALKHLSSLRKISSFKTWLLRIATNFVNDFYRKEKRRTKVKENLKFNDKNDDPVEFVYEDTYKLLIRKYIRTLPIQYQTVIYLKFFEEKSVKEIAYIMKKTPVGARVMLHRALNALKRRIERDVTDKDSLRLFNGENETGQSSSSKKEGKEER